MSTEDSPRIYLDHQASTPPSRACLRAMEPYLSDGYANPHSDDHAAGWAASAAVEAARASIARAIDVDPEELVFTSGATEANNLALLGVAAARTGPGRIVVSSIDHKSVLGPARALSRRGFEVSIVPVDGNGAIDLDRLELAVDASTALVSIGAVNNEIGTVQPMERIVEICRSKGVPVHSDATQALAWTAADIGRWGVDFASLSSHKAGGPKGIGAFYVAHHSRHHVAPVQFGGEQEGGLRPGTLPTLLCAGFGGACSELPSDAEVVEWRRVTQRLLGGIRGIWPNARLNGSERPRHPGNLNLTIPDVPADRLLALLQPGLAISRGSACTSGTPEPSHVLSALGLSADESARSFRMSTAAHTTAEEVDRALELIRRAAGRL